MTEKYSGLAITPKELQKFMIEEQASPTQKYSLVKYISLFSRVIVIQLKSAQRSSATMR